MHTLNQTVTVQPGLGIVSYCIYLCESFTCQIATAQRFYKILSWEWMYSTTHSTYKGPNPFQTGPMQKYYRILTSMDPMYVLLTVI